MEHAVLQHALNSLGPAGGTLTVGPIDHFITNDLYIPSNVIMQGAGPATQLILSPGAAIVISGKSNVRIRDVYINADAHVARQRAVVIANSRDITIENSWVLRCGGFGIFLSGESNTEMGKVRITGCRLSGKGNNDIIGGGPRTAGSIVSEVIVTDNYLQQDCTNGTYRNAIDIVACTRTVISQNIVEGCIMLGGEKIPHVTVDVSHNIMSPAVNYPFCQLALLAQSDAGQSDLSHSIRFIGNDITSGQIYVQGQKATGSRTFRVLIQSNIVKALANYADPGINRGIVVSFGRDMLIDGNIVDGAAKGIVAGDVKNLRLGKSNHILNCPIPVETDSLTTLAS
jgi:hypothetical protein